MRRARWLNIWIATWYYTRVNVIGAWSEAIDNRRLQHPNSGPVGARIVILRAAVNETLVSFLH